MMHYLFASQVPTLEIKGGGLQDGVRMEQVYISLIRDF